MLMLLVNWESSLVIRKPTDSKHLREGGNRAGGLGLAPDGLGWANFPGLGWLGLAWLGLGKWVS